MSFRPLSLLLLISCAPAGSFFVPPTRLPYSSSLRQQHLHDDVNFNGAAAPGSAAAAPGCDSRRVVWMDLSSTSLQSRNIFRAASPARTLRGQRRLAAASATTIADNVEELPRFISNDAVSYWAHPANGPSIWLVGTIHQTEASVKLVEEVVGGIKPEVVMVELCSDRICLLPPGEAMQTKNGLWWWSPEKEQEGMAEEGDEEDEEDCDEDGEALDGQPSSMNEILAAVREAEACGARVLLGDREFQSTARLLENAKRMDMASAKERASFDELTASFDCEESTRAVTRRECEQMKATAPKVFAVMCTQRDQVMAKHLMKLRGDQTAVAVFGMAHLDGVEKVLKGHGWKRQRP